jgi:hypothetical protein
MWPYILNVIAVAIFPLALAGIGGHLATLALPENTNARRNWKLGIWAIAIIGVVLFGVSQEEAYRADQARDAKVETFQAKVLERLSDIANEPSRSKRQEAVREVAASLAKITPSVPVSAHTVKSIPAPVVPVGKDNPTSPPMPAPDDSPTPSTIAACPTAGKLAMLWHISISDNGAPNFTYDINPSVKQSLHPALSGLIQVEDQSPLNSAGMLDYKNLVKELTTLVPKAQPIETAKGAVYPNVVLETVVHDFRENAIVRYWYRPHLAGGGGGLGGTMSTIPIANLPRACFINRFGLKLVTSA